MPRIIPLRTPRFFTVFLLAASLPLGAQTWSGGGANNNFTNSANWAGGSAPANNGTASATLSGVTRTTPLLDADYALSSLLLSASGFTLDGSATLTLGSSLLKTTTTYLSFTANVPIILGGNLTVGGSGTQGDIKLNGGISGSHGLTFSGGSLFLGGTNTFGGDLQINSGGVYLGTSNTVAAGSLTSNVVLGTGASFTVFRQGNVTIDQVISGTGSSFNAFSVSGGFSSRDSTTVTLTRQNSYTGGTTVTGTLVIGVANALPIATPLSLSSFGTIKLLANQTVGNNSGGTGSLIDIASAATFTANLTANSTTGGTTGAGSVALTGAYNLQTYDAWGHTGGTTITATNLIIGNGFTYGGLVGDVINNGQVTFNKSNPTTYAGNISGTGTLTKISNNTLTLTGNSTQANTTVTAGVLAIGAGGTTGSISGNIALSSGTTLNFNRGDNSTYGGVISGSGDVAKYGVGQLTFGNTNTVAGNLTVSGGRLIAAAANALGDTHVNVSSGTLEIGASQSIRSLTGSPSTGIQFNGGSTVTVTADSSTLLRSSLTGTGNFVKQGAGAVTLNGGGTVAGTITAQAGTVFATGTYGSAALAITSGGTFSPGALRTTGAATFQTLSLAGGSTFNFGITNATGTAGHSTNGWDLLSTTGAVTLAGTAGNQITLALESLNGSGGFGSIGSFNYNSNFSWNLITGAGGITGFEAGAFAFNTTNFAEAANPAFTGTLSVSQVGNSLYLNYTAASAIPEPATYATIAGGLALAGAAWSRRRRAERRD